MPIFCRPILRFSDISLCGLTPKQTTFCKLFCFTIVMPASVSMLRFVLVLLCCLMLPGCVLADDQGCYTSGSVAGIVIATVVVTLVMGGLAAAFIWYLWKQRKAGYGENKSMEKPIMCPPMSPDKQMIARESNDYAFDNPYFKDDETDRANPDAAEKGESGFRTDNGDIASAQNAKASNGTSANHQKRSRPFSSLPFHAVFLPSGKKQQRATMDDTYISKHLERITVPLRGHDFTGLGFNICGNMRDGIFVKDVLHRGPASESGKIKAGDRIVGVTVSFAAMVYEDALTILSYASPYDVRLEIEKAPATSTVTLPPSSPKRLGTSTSFRNNGQRRLFHPLYRSQSIDDLTQIGKDGFGVINTSGSQRESSSSNTPKRSQSVEASNGGLKTRPPFLVKTEEAKSPSSKGSRKSSTSSCESTAKAVTPTEKSQPVLNEEPCTKKEVKSARFRIQQVNVKTEAPTKVVPPAKPARESHEEKLQSSNDTADKSSEVISKTSNGIPAEDMTKPEKSSRDVQNASESESDVSDKPTAPPRKSSNTPKRKAPAPPPVSAPKTETSAVVHRTDDLQKQSPVAQEKMSHSDGSEAQPTLSLSNATNETASTLTGSFVSTTQESQMATKEMPVFSSTEKMGDPGTGSSDTSSLTSGDNSSSKMDKDDQNTSPGKRKAASLGDLTKLEHGIRKTSISSAILERAVSLDLQQSIPGENLTKHKKILRAPAFEDDYLEDREDLTELNGQGLKRWDDGLDKVFAKLPNGNSKLDEEFNDELSPSAESVEKEEVNSSNLDSKTEINITSIRFKLDSNNTEIGTVLENNNFGIDKHREANDNENNNPEINLTETNSSPDISHTEMNKKQQINHSEINNNATINHAEINKNPEISHSEINSNIEFNGTESNNNPETNHDEIIRTVTNHSEIDDFDSALITESSTEKPAPDLRNDSPLRELPLPNLQDLPSPLTSTPVKKVIEVKGLLEDDDDDIDDVPYLASAGDKNREESSTKFTTKSNSSSTTPFPLVAINIPVIKPDLTQFEKLPSPPPASTHPALEPTWRMSKTLSLDDGSKTSLERITVHSLYKPIFTGKEINNIDEPLHPASPEKMVNGNESDASEHYSTAQENTSTSSVETSSISMTLSSPTAKEVIRTPNTIAGFAKTLIIPSPNDVENLLSLAAEPNTPPPVLESSAKPVEKE